jgi:hypothetical protein
MAFYLVVYEGTFYANTELYTRAVAGGERSFMKMLAEGAVAGKPIFDRMMYPVTDEQLTKCQAFEPQYQDIDEELAALREAGEGHEGRTITISKALAQKVVQHKGFEFMKIRDLNQPEKYRLIPKLATVRLCSCTYVALRAVSEGVENPIVVIVSD